MTGFIITILILSVIFLLLLAPLKIVLRLNNSAYFKVKYLGITLYNVNSEKKQHKKKTQEKISAPKKTKFKELLKKYSDGKSKAEILKELLDIIKTFFESFKRFIKHIVFKNINFELTIGSDEAAKTAILYGGFCTVVSSLVTLLSNSRNFKPSNIAVKTDFSSEQISVLLDCTIKIKLLYILAFAFSLALKLLKNKIGEMKNGRT